MAKKSNQIIRFKYVFPDDYNPNYANGVIGGMTPHGEILMHFYQERHALPRDTCHELVQGKVGECISEDGGDVVAIRYIQGGVTLTLEAARVIHEWLGENLAQLSQMRSRTGTPGSGNESDET